MPAPTREQMENFGSLITIKGTNTCLGDLLHANGQGTFDPEYGLVDVTKDEADAHNKALDKAKLEGLDKNCEIGQGSFFYYNEARSDKPAQVTTFLGTVVTNDVVAKPAKTIQPHRFNKTHYWTITFRRAGKTYRGRLGNGVGSGNAFNFKRIA